MGTDLAVIQKGLTDMLSVHCLCLCRCAKLMHWRLTAYFDRNWLLSVRSCKWLGSWASAAWQLHCPPPPHLTRCVSFDAALAAADKTCYVSCAFLCKDCLAVAEVACQCCVGWRLPLHICCGTDGCNQVLLSCTISVAQAEV